MSSGKLTIRRWNTQAKRARDPGVFTATLNPAKYSRASAVQYVEVKNRPGVPGRKFKSVDADTLELDELIIDGTGVVTGSGDVEDEIALLKRIILDPAGDPKVRYAVVEVLWGKLVFRGRVTGMTVSYTLFDASGTPLRARVKLNFVAYIEDAVKLPGEGAKAPAASKKAVVGSDTLSNLCFEKYDDASLSAFVAMANGLSTIRRLPPGISLTFPKRG